MNAGTIRTSRRAARARSLTATLGLAVAGTVLVGLSPGTHNPGVFPPQSNPYGKPYGEWAAAWWQWAFGIPAAENPLLDTTGEFADVDQSGPVWFLAGTFGGSAQRTVTVPLGKALYIPLLNSSLWAPEDVGLAAFIVEFLGLDPDDFSEEELLRIAANFGISNPTLLSCTVDGVELVNLDRYLADSPGFPIEDTDLIDDFGIPISQPNNAVAAAYAVMLAPLSAGEHTIEFAGAFDNPLFGMFETSVTYDVTVVPKSKLLNN